MKQHILGLIVFTAALSASVYLALPLAIGVIIQPEQTIPFDSVAEKTLTTIDPPTAVTTKAKDENSDTQETRNEYFSDDRRIGRRGRNKIELRCFSDRVGRFAELKFYSQSEYGSWVEVNSFKFEKDGVTNCNPIVEDFNNDGLKDFTYESNVAARGSNQVRKLFIYDKDLDDLVYVVNSEEYPNLSYNKRLDCVDSFIITGTAETVFLRINGNMLNQFASVSTGSERVVTVTRNDGTEVILRREEMDPDNFEEVYRRFSSYDPLR